jgi:protein gp37
MSTKTTISWTRNPDGSPGKTWNPTTGCDKVSPGCDNCYALGQAPRLKAMHSPAYQVDGNPKTSGPGFALQMHEGRLTDPFAWKPTRVFVNSMSDLFHTGVAREFVAKVFAVMALTPQHTYQILTKRHTPMRSLLNDSSFRSDVAAARLELLSTLTLDIRTTPDTLEWPLPNVWLGVSVENQKWADLRIPELLATPAAVRFLSCEPLLGPVDLSAYLPPRVPMLPDDAPPVWSDWNWDDWVTPAIRQAVEQFWPADRGGPRAWLRDALKQGSHAYGQAVNTVTFNHPREYASGRWVHAWNNIGRLAHADGSHSYVSFWPDEVREQRHLDWVIVGGESGRGDGIRPMHHEWVRGLHRQTEAGGAAFFMKQTGVHLAKEWGATGKGEDPAEWQVPWPQDFPDTPAPLPVTTKVGESA